MPEITIKEALGLGVLGAFVSTLGTLIGLFLKDFIAVRAFERWKAKIAAEQVFRRYRDPLALACAELANRLCEVLSSDRPNFLNANVLGLNATRIERNDAYDPYFLRYKFDSTMYRLASVLGWVELFRQDITFLDSGHSHRNDQITECLSSVRAALADGHLNQADDWGEWRDCLIFREEQRAIGESMIDPDAVPRRVLGFDRFLKEHVQASTRWHLCTTGFFEDFGATDRDFRVTRSKILLVALVRLHGLTSGSLLQARVREAAARYASELEQPELLPISVDKSLLARAKYFLAALSS